MRLTIHHGTVYRYRTPVRYSIQYLRLTPRAEAGQRIVEWRLETPARTWQQTDAFGNVVHVLSRVEPHDETRITVHGAVETSLVPGTPVEDRSGLPPAVFLVPTLLTVADDGLADLADRTIGSAVNPRSGVEALIEAIVSRVRYEPGSTDVDHTAAQALALGRGVCQDHAHIFLACARAAGVPARYVSGYIDANDPGHVSSHAWADVWIDGGWVSYDVTHAALAGPALCRLAVGRDYADASPVRGIRRGGAGEELAVAVRVSAAAEQ